MAFPDDYTATGAVYFLKHKSEVEHAFKNTRKLLKVRKILRYSAQDYIGQVNKVESISKISLKDTEFL